MTRLVAMLDRTGVSPALVVGLVLMPLVIATGFLGSHGSGTADVTALLRPSIAPDGEARSTAPGPL